MRVQRFLKGQLDFWGSALALIVLFVPFVIVGILIKVDSKGPVFFRQERVGKDSETFRVWKFRSMIENAEQTGLKYEVSREDDRITKIGRFLRRFAIDELPQVFNILQGDMSLVGPRTALPHQVAQYTDFEKQRLRVKPGMANLNILKGWNTLPWKERIKWDVWYIEHWSLWLDLKILLFTFIIVLLGKGQYGAKGVVEDYK